MINSLKILSVLVIVPTVATTTVVNLESVVQLLIWLFCFDLVTGILASYFEWRKSAPKDHWFFGKGEGFSSDKFKKCFVKVIIYGVTPLIVMKFQRTFLIKNIKVESVTESEIELTSAFIIAFCAIELFSIFFENLPKCGFNIMSYFKKFVGISKEVKKTLVAIFICLLAVTSCKPTQTLQNTTAIKETIKDTSYSNKEKEINKAVNDLITLYNLQQVRTGKPECDSVTRIAIENMLRGFAQSKKSGENGYQLYFDELSKKLLLQIKIGQTQNEKSETGRTLTIDNSTHTIREIPVKEPTPKWQLYLFIAGIISLVLHGVSIYRYFSSKWPFSIVKK